MILCIILQIDSEGSAWIEDFSKFGTFLDGNEKTIVGPVQLSGTDVSIKIGAMTKELK